MAEAAAEAAVAAVTPTALEERQAEAVEQPAGKESQGSQWCPGAARTVAAGVVAATKRKAACAESGPVCTVTAGREDDAKLTERQRALSERIRDFDLVLTDTDWWPHLKHWDF